MEQVIYYLDILGTFAFAVYGSYYALKAKLDLFGIFLCAFLTALGGGTIRELLLGNVPFYFFNNVYIFTVLIAMAFAIIMYNKFHKIKRMAIILDSLGLVTFAFIGASIAAENNLGTLGIILLATVSAVGGGVLRDVLINKLPEVLYRDFYAVIAMLLGLVYAVFTDAFSTLVPALVLITVFFGLRLLVLYYRTNLWRPYHN